MSSEKNWKDLPLGGVITEAGNAVEYETGSWRTYRPVRDVAKCTNCMICWVLCPDSSIQVKDGKMTGFDYAHCKGCGICAKECPTKCIAMVLETEAQKKEG